MTEISQRIEAFFEFIYQRQAVWHNRFIKKQPSPWTDDPILQNFRFCNVYRQLDGGTEAISKYLCSSNISPETKLFNIIAYRFFNRRDTIEHLFGGLLAPTNFDFKLYEQRFDKIKQNETIFSDAYLITACAYNKNYRPQDKHVQVLLVLENLKNRLSSIIQELRSATPQEGLHIIEQNIPLAGSFLSGQILLDATYAKDIVSYSGNDFLIVGPGAHWGLNIIFGKKLSYKEADLACRQLYNMQAHQFALLKQQKGLNWHNVCWQNPEYPNAPYLMLHDIQNSLCEFRKYWRLKHGENAKKRYYKS